MAHLTGNIGKPDASRIEGTGAVAEINHMFTDNYGFQKYPSNNFDQIGSNPSNNPKSVDKTTDALAGGRRQAGEFPTVKK